MKLVNRNAKANLILSRFVFCAMIIFLYACGSGGGGDDTSSGTGSVSFGLALQDQGTVEALNSQAVQAFISLAAVNSEGQFKCETEEYLIVEIEAQVVDENDKLLAEGGPWKCKDRQGTIGAVKAGDGRIVKVFAIDESGEIIFFGKSGPFTVKIGQQTDVGKIYLETVNRSPVLDPDPIGNKEVLEGELLEIEMYATDADGDQLLFEIGNKPADAIFTSEDLGVDDLGVRTVTAKFSWRPSFESAGNYENVIFKVTDNGVPSLSDFEEITISVGNVPLPPVLDPIGNRSGNEGELLEINISAEDPDSLNLSFEMGSKPPDAEFTFVNGKDGSGTATFSWIPNFDDAGNYPVIFKVFDDNPAEDGGPLNDFEEITIAVGPVCRTPVLDPIVPPTGKNEGELIEFTVTAKDPDLPDDALTFSCASEDIPFCEDYFDPPLFSWTPGFDDAGNNTVVRFTVTDSCPDGPLSDSKDVTITVGDTCRPPVLDPIGDQSVIEGEELRFTIAATDPDLPNDALSFSCESESEVINCSTSFDPSTRIFSWTPGGETQGEYIVRFIVTDACQDESGPLQDFEDVIITVATPPCIDLVVERIDYPEDGENSRVQAVIKNIGNQTAGPSLARIFDLTPSDVSEPYTATAPTGELSPGESVTVTFQIPSSPYYVHLRVIADSEGDISECNEKNNDLEYEFYEDPV